MTKKLIIKIMKAMNTSCPDLEMAAYDASGKLLGSMPSILRQPLPARPCFIIDDNQCFTAALPVNQKEGVFSFRGTLKHPEDAQMYYALAQRMIDLIYQQEATLHQISLQNDETSRLLNRLFNSTNEEDVSYVFLSATHQGYDLTLKRVIILLDFSAARHNLRSPTEIIAPLLPAFKYMTEMNEQDLAGQLNEHQIVICKTLPDTGETNLKDQCTAFLYSVRSLLNSRCEIPVWISVGNIPASVPEYGQGLILAQNALKLAKQFGNEEKICFIDDYLLEYEISQIPRSILDHFFGPYIQVLSSSSWMFETLKALVLNHMEQKKTANSLYIHRNTLGFRLKQIREKLNLDPYGRDSDRFTLIAFYIYTVLYHPHIIEE